MQVKWGKMAAKVTMWFAVEILLSLVGLDNLADYGEFTLNDTTLTASNSALQMVVEMAKRSNNPLLLNV